MEGTAGSWAKPKGHLLPFCSRTILKHPQMRDTQDQHKGTGNYSSFPAFFTRSEGYRHGLKKTHNPKVVGSNPTRESNLMALSSTRRADLCQASATSAPLTSRPPAACVRTGPQVSYQAPLDLVLYLHVKCDTLWQEEQRPHSRP